MPCSAPQRRSAGCWRACDGAGRPDLERLPYLQAIVKETLRLRMAIPLLVPHMNLNDGKLAGYDIPAESKILVNA